MEKRLQILVLDDDSRQAGLLAETIQRLGHIVQTCTRPQEALDIVRQQSPNLVITDLRMPGMDGFQFRVEQMSDPSIAGIPVVILTADGKVHENSEALGQVGWLRKPIDFDELLQTVARSFPS